MIIALRFPHILCFFKNGALVICLIFLSSFLRLPAQIQISHRPTLGSTCAVHMEPLVLRCNGYIYTVYIYIYYIVFFAVKQGFGSR